jgi:hypothetical protein
MQWRETLVNNIGLALCISKLAHRNLSQTILL